MKMNMIDTDAVTFHVHFTPSIVNVKSKSVVASYQCSHAADSTEMAKRNCLRDVLQDTEAVHCCKCD